MYMERCKRVRRREKERADSQPAAVSVDGSQQRESGVEQGAAVVDDAL